MFLGLDHPVLVWTDLSLPLHHRQRAEHSSSTRGAPWMAGVKTPCELASLHQPLERLYRPLPFLVGFTIILSLFSWEHMVTCHLGRKGSGAIFPLSLKPCSHLGKIFLEFSCLVLFPWVLWSSAILYLEVIYRYFLPAPFISKLLFFHLCLLIFWSLLVERDWLELRGDNSFYSAQLFKLS